MEIIISLNQNDFSLELAEKDRSVDSEKVLYYHDLEEKLITSLDKLLKRNSIDITAIKDYKLVSSLGENSTSAKIAESVIEGLKS